MPRADLGERISADYEEKFVARREARAHLFNGIDGIAPLGAFFQPRNLHFRQPLARDLSHPQTILVRRMRERALMRWIIGRHQQHAIQAAAADGLVGDCQVGLMNGVESTAENRQSQDVRAMSARFSPS